MIYLHLLRKISQNQELSWTATSAGWSTYASLTLFLNGTSFFHCSLPSQHVPPSSVIFLTFVNLLSALFYFGHFVYFSTHICTSILVLLSFVCVCVCTVDEVTRSNHKDWFCGRVLPYSLSCTHKLIMVKYLISQKTIIFKTMFHITYY